MDHNVCPLLKDPKGYNPDTVDLVNNVQERDYWLPCLENMVRNFISRASYLNPEYPNATESAEVCFQKFHNLAVKAAQDQRILTPLSIRTLLEFNEDNLRDNNFKDAWRLQKDRETKAALKQFAARIAALDSIDEFKLKWLEIVTGALAGNVFDWGSSAVSDILEATAGFDLSNAIETIEKRPWFQDDLDKWIKRLAESAYKQVVIFVDNAGVDFILGILPLAREFLKSGSKVILCANSAPSLNDVTFRELNTYIREASQYCDVLAKAINISQLTTAENGQKGPCLDLKNLTPDLCKIMSSADLIMLEGMGRAVHTNLYAEFTVDAVKLAVLKNDWLAKSLGARQFSVIFKYEPANV